ncbi:2Fe-2S iron-sulfur cluster-binding protein [Streptomyces sp. NPDC008150]|uniref:2Fe-2S iron-sulfur cluster-binding protein n=1 Tax=Streptomyces sp. NPDC008150 TaxID=3364816 RepID=UPI0036EC954F
MTDDQHGEDASRGPGRWDPLPQGDYDDGATAFVQLPEGGIDALLAAADSPLAAPGHGYVPPRITAMPAAEQAADPAVDGSWGIPAGPDAGPWPDPAAASGHPGHDDRFTYRPEDTGGGQWDVHGATGGAGRPDRRHHDQQPPAPAGGATGQWSIPVAGGELPDESGEFTTSSLVEQWGGNPPSTLPGGAAAPWATDGAGQQWAAQQQPGAAQQGPAPTMPDQYRPAGYPPAEHPHEQGAFGAGGAQPSYGRDAFGRDTHVPDPQDHDPQAHEPHTPGPHASYGGEGLRVQDGTHDYDTARPAAPDPRHDAGYDGREDAGHDAGYDPRGGQHRDERLAGAYAEAPTGNTDPYAPSAGTPGLYGEPPAPGAERPYAEGPVPGVHGPSAADGRPGGTAGAPEPQEAAEGPSGAAEDAGAPRAEDEPADETEPLAEPAPDAEPGPAAGPGGPADAEDGPGADADRATAGVFAAADADAESEPVSPPPLPHDEHPVASYVLSVNGVDRPVTDAWVGESLLYVLRERLGLAGAKDGCSQGECGACNVQVDGRLVASCLVPAVTAAGSEVRTVEGLAVDGQPSDVQRALARCGAVQCGFCVPGMAMTVHDLLEGNPAPSERETRQALCGNLCRCSGYRGILDAVNEVVAEREAHNAAAHATDSDEPRIPHQAGPGDGGVSPSAFDGAEPHEQPYGQDGGQA